MMRQRLLPPCPEANAFVPFGSSEILMRNGESTAWQRVDSPFVFLRGRFALP